tara:strand:- start:158 stop:298 length:141 start_codon:yes stop_codon:yes gene_type:complete
MNFMNGRRDRYFQILSVFWYQSRQATNISRSRDTRGGNYQSEIIIR